VTATTGVLPGTVAEAARRFGDTPAFVAAAGWPVTYTGLARLADEAAGGLAARGIGEGDVVALVLPSTVDYVVAYLAAARVGAATAGVNPRLTPPERAAVLDVADPALVLTTAALAEGAPDAVPRIVVTPATTVEDVLRPLRGTGSPRAAPPTLPPDPDRLVAIVFTSGTTGTPRGAMFTDRELAAIVAADVGDTWGGGGPMLASTQFAHVGFMTKLAWYLRLGTTTYLLDRWRAGDVLRLIVDHRIPSVGVVAPQLALMLRDPAFDELDLSHVRTIVAGGAFSPPELVREARERFGAAYSIRYSSTESGGVGVGTAFDADDEEALHTVGRPRPGVELEIRDDDDRPVPDGEVGEIVLRSPCTMRGYWRDPGATAEALRNGWLHTGDLGRVDEQGCLRLAGRRREMFVRGGYNVYPLEVEAVLGEHPAVAEVVVVPRPDPVMGEVGVACVVPVAGAEPPTVDELRSFAGERLAHHKLPEDVVVLEEVPLTPMQKVDRRALADRVRSPG
jgi:acyl-CoA synthetase (AMP-forming)/AMP-acid ligase II